MHCQDVSHDLRFRWNQLKIRQGQKVVNELLVDFPPFAHDPIFIVLLLPTGEVAHDGIYKDVSRASWSALAGKFVALVIMHSLSKS